LFAYFRRGWLEGSKTKSRWDIDEYPLRAHPDLTEKFRSLAPAADVMNSSAYGHPVMANSSGLVFAWAGGTHYIMLRLSRELQQQAIDEGGRFNPTYGKDWIEFIGFGPRLGQRTDWKELTRWMRIAYQESLTLKTDG